MVEHILVYSAPILSLWFFYLLVDLVFLEYIWIDTHFVILLQFFPTDDSVGVTNFCNFLESRQFVVLTKSTNPSTISIFIGFGIALSSDFFIHYHLLFVGVFPKFLKFPLKFLLSDFYLDCCIYWSALFIAALAEDTLGLLCNSFVARSGRKDFIGVGQFILGSGSNSEVFVRSQLG